MKKLLKLMLVDITLFGTNKTTDADLSAEMKTYYSDYLIDNAEPLLVHDQFGQKRPIPANGGKNIEFRKYDQLPKALTPLSEGVTPSGKSLKVSTVTATIAQYGDFVELSDLLLMTAIDNNQVEAAELLASQAGRTLDTVTREVLNGGTGVLYSNGKESRSALVGGDSTAANNCYLSVNDIKLAVRQLKKMNAPKIDGYYCAIIHPDAAYDLMNDSDWKYPHQYVDTKEIYNGEIGMLHGVRFVETTEAKIFHGDDLASNSRTLKINKNGGYSGAITSVTFDGGTVADDALIGRYIQINKIAVKVTDNTTTTITFASTDFGTISDDDVIYPGEAGAEGRDVYSTLVLGANAYGVTELANGGLQYIAKQLGSSGTADALNQRATSGWKAAKTAERLVESNMVRIESATSFNDIGSN